MVDRFYGCCCLLHGVEGRSCSSRPLFSASVQYPASISPSSWYGRICIRCRRGRWRRLTERRGAFGTGSDRDNRSSGVRSRQFASDASAVADGCIVFDAIGGGLLVLGGISGGAAGERSVLGEIRGWIVEDEPIVVGGFVVGCWLSERIALGFVIGGIIAGGG